MHDPLEISSAVSSALNQNIPVIALESSVIANGLPDKVNVETALAVEEEVKKAGAVPATIGIVEGKVKVGLSEDDIKILGNGKAAKIAAKDIQYASYKKMNGGTTVSATAKIALTAGISIMSTGGIGGVHRGWEKSYDISSDLWEILRTPIVIVSSGIKTILDAYATAQWLETHCVPLFTLGSEDFPSFYSSKSGIKSNKFDNISETAEFIKEYWGLFGIRPAMLMGVPVPSDVEVNAEKFIETAIKEAEEKGIAGKDITPWLLNRVNELSDGKCLRANIELLKNNAKIAAEIAVKLKDTNNKRLGFI